MSTGAARRAARRGREPREARTPRARMNARHTGEGGAQQREDPRGREGQALDLDAPVGERVLDGGGDDGAGRDHAALADPLDPELVHAGGKLDVDEIDRREVAGAWERVVHQRARQELSRAVVDDLLDERA